MDHTTISRRNWLKGMGFVTLSPLGLPNVENPIDGNLKLSLNAYSFHRPLTEGRMTLDDLLDFCARYQLDGLDLTAYYFPGYPEVPPDDFLFEIKRKAFRKGLSISGTGVRNEFVHPDAEKRKEEVDLVKRWIVAASKLGAPVIRIFAGHNAYENYSREQVLEWVVAEIQTCVEYGKKYGVMVAIQNHNAFLRTADQAISLIQMVNSPWFGLILDIGSFREGDPYAEIEKCIPYAVSWQVKETVYRQGTPEKTDLVKLFELIMRSKYRGYLPLETLGPGDPFLKVPAFLEEARVALKN